MTFVLTNTTNGRQDFIFSASQRASGTSSIGSGNPDTIDLTNNVKICLDSTCSAGDITNTNISLPNELSTVTLYLFADISHSTPGLPGNGDIAGINLIATAVEDGTTNPIQNTTNPDNKDAVDIVLADGAGSDDNLHDGKFSTFSAYEVESAVLTLSKDSCIIWDPINLGNNPKRIPGAVVRYVFNVNNTGAIAGNTVSVTDTLNSALSFGTSSPAPTGIAVVKDAACNCLSPAGNDVSNASVSAASQNVTADFISVPANSSACAYIEFEIN